MVLLDLPELNVRAFGSRRSQSNRQVLKHVTRSGTRLGLERRELAPRSLGDVDRPRIVFGRACTGQDSGEVEKELSARVALRL